MKHFWYAMAITAMIAMIGTVGCSALSTGVITQTQNDQLPQKQAVAVESTPTSTSSGSTPTTATRTAPNPPSTNSPRSTGGTPPAQGNNRVGGPGGPGVSGTVKSVNGSTIVVTAQDGSTTTIKTDGNTAFQKVVSTFLADIKTGIVVMMTTEQSGSVTTARTVQIGVAPGGAAPPAQGSGQPAGAPAGQGNGRPAGTQPSASGGQPGAAPGGRPGIGGTVKSVSGKTIQVTTQDGSSITVQVDDKTTYQKTASATLADVQTGTRISVVSDSTTGTVTAKMIQIGGSIP
jgi:hypothetical protein